MQLMYIVAIADSGLNVSAAARQLNKSQPEVSKQLQWLEKELGGQIFVRNGKSFVGITKAGKQIIARARKVVDEAERIQCFTQDVNRISSAQQLSPKKYAPDR